MHEAPWLCWAVEVRGRPLLGGQEAVSQGKQGGVLSLSVMCQVPSRESDFPSSGWARLLVLTHAAPVAAIRAEKSPAARGPQTAAC